MLREKNEAAAQRATKRRRRGGNQFVYQTFAFTANSLRGRRERPIPPPQASNGKIENALGAQLGLGDGGAGRDEGDAP